MSPDGLDGFEPVTFSPDPPPRAPGPLVDRFPGTHFHMLLGGVPRDVVRELLDAWPRFFTCRTVYNRWGAIHYCLSQHATKWEHAQDVYSDCYALLSHPFMSDNLPVFWDLLLARKREAARAAGRRGSRVRWGRGPSLKPSEFEAATCRN